MGAEQSTSEMKRLELSGYDIRPKYVPDFVEKLTSIGFKEQFIDPRNPYFATIYFSTKSSDLRRGFRYRIYGLNEERARDFSIRPEDIGSLEYKLKSKESGDNISEHKYRETAGAVAVNSLIKNINSAREILDTLRSPEISDKMPQGKLPDEILKRLAEETFGEEIFPTMVVVTKRRHFVTSVDDENALRITIDDDAGYFGFNPFDKEKHLYRIPEPLVVHAEPACRIEIKLSEEKNEEHLFLARAMQVFLENLPDRLLFRKSGTVFYNRHFYGYRRPKDRFSIVLSDKQ